MKNREIRNFTKVTEIPPSLKVGSFIIQVGSESIQYSNNFNMCISRYVGIEKILHVYSRL